MWSASHPGCLTSEVVPPDRHWTGVCMDPKCQSTHFEKKNLLLLPEFKPWIIQPIAYSLYDYAIPAPFWQVLTILHYFVCVDTFRRSYVPTWHTKKMVHQLNATFQHTATNYEHHTQSHAIQIGMYYNALILWFCFGCKVPWAHSKNGYINHLNNKTPRFCTCYDSEFIWHSRHISKRQNSSHSLVTYVLGTWLFQAAYNVK
jgi:hypothetical protein